MTGRRPHRWAALLTLALVAGCSKEATPAGSPSPRAPSPSTAASPVPSPAPVPLFDDPIGVAVDGRGNVWVANYRGSTLQMFGGTDVASAAGQAHPVPRVVLTGLGGPNQLEFDRHGRLWLAQWDDDSLVAYVPSQLLRSGSPTPAVRITGAHLSFPTDLAFDRSGNLWAANQGNGEIVQYTAADLDRGGQLRPRVVLRQSAAEGAPPYALAFDGQGWLWVTSYYDDLLVAFAPDRLAASGSPVPNVRVKLSDGSGPIGVTVDDRGRVWVAEAGSHAIAGFPPGVKATPSIQPAVTISGPDLEMPHSITFAEDGAWVPCYNDTVLRYGPDQTTASTSAPPELILS